MSDIRKQDLPRICYLCKVSPQHYKRLDQAILETRFDVRVHNYTYTVGNMLEFKNRMRDADLVYAWFASPWLGLMLSLIPKRVKLVLVAGGYDVANCEVLKHGARFHPIRGCLTRRVLARADLVLPVSNYNQKEMLSWVTPKAYEVVYNSVDLPRFSLVPSAKRRSKVMTVGIIGEFISKCKGHYRFLEIARRLPDCEFVLMGKPMDATVKRLRDLAPQNVRIVDYTSRADMICELLSSSVYLQLSYYESFGVSVAEALYCGCYPIVSKGTALEEIVQGQGESVDADDTEAVVASVVNALEAELHRTIDVSRLSEVYSVSNRSERLIHLISDLL